MWIIFEGADGAGKSTLVEATADELRETLLPVTVTHLGPPAKPSTALTECVEGPYLDYVVGRSHLVSDRWGWGCPVYGPIYRPEDDLDGYGDFGIGGFRYSELFALSRGAYFVLVDGEPDELRRRLEFRGDDYVDLDDLDAIVQKYRTLTVETLSLGTVTPAGMPRERVPAEVDDIVKEAAARERRADLLSPWPHYVGPVNPTRVYQASRQEAVEILSGLGEDWRTAGFVDPAKTSARQRARLHETLGSPPTEKSNVLYATF